MAAQLQNDLNAAVDTTAGRIADYAQMFAPRKTGALKGSIYALTPRRDDYAAAVSRVLTAQPAAEDVFEDSGADSDKVFPRVILSRVPGKSEARVLCAVTYGLFVEHGMHTGKSNTPARYFMRRAVEAARGGFVADVARAVKGLERGKATRAPRQLTPQQAQEREERELRALRNSIERQTTRDKMDMLGANLLPEEFNRQRSALGNKASGAGYWEDFNERAERLNNRFEELKQEFSANGDYWG